MTRTEKIIRNIAGCFLLRNLFLFGILVSINTGMPLALGHLTFKELLIETILLTNSYFAFLVHNLVLYRYLLKQRRYVLYAIAVLSLLFLTSRTYSGTRYLLYGEASNYPWQKWVAMYWVELIFYWAGLSVYLAYIYYRDRERLFQVEQEKKELELQQLNEQLNPHFLFNALNNIYSHLLTESSSGKELILKLSELMRYVLDSSKKKQVLLEEEIAFVEHYIAFQKERLGNRCQVYFDKNSLEKDVCVIPLVLFNFIENAFKYGTTTIKPTEIDIRIRVKEKQLELFVRNEIHTSAKASTYTGLENTRRRLELLYPGQYVLDISEDDGHFMITLKLYNLTCHSAAL